MSEHIYFLLRSYRPACRNFGRNQIFSLHLPSSYLKVFESESCEGCVCVSKVKDYKTEEWRVKDIKVGETSVVEGRRSIVQL